MGQARRLIVRLRWAASLLDTTNKRRRSKITPGEDEPIDGFAELWFDSEAAQQGVYCTEQYTKVVADAANLFDPTSRAVHPPMEIRTEVIVP